VLNFEKDSKPASTVTLGRVYDTSVDDLWDALTSKERIPRWFLLIEGDLKLGGEYQLKGNAGGAITVCTPPSHFAATWEFGGQTSWIDVKITAAGSKAQMTLEHTAFVGDHWNQFRPGAVGIGWDLAVMGLARHLATGASADRAAAGAWMGSPNGKEFVRLSGESWRIRGAEAYERIRGPIRPGAPPHTRDAWSWRSSFWRSGRRDRGRVRNHAGGGVAAP
jgi:uncharacterized protein YndB with AHSA1/START domain